MNFAIGDIHLEECLLLVSGEFTPIGGGKVIDLLSVHSFRERRRCLGRRMRNDWLNGVILLINSDFNNFGNRISICFANFH